MNTRVFLGVSAAALLGLALSIVLTFTALSRAQTPAQKSLGRTTPAPAPARTGGAELEVRLLGAVSARDENDDDEPDDVFTRPMLRVGSMGATRSGATAGGGTPTDATKTGGGSGDSGGPTPLSRHPNAAQMIERLRQTLQGSEVDVALLGSHKYMVADCLGIKVSAGTFKMRLAEPKIYFQGTALIFECGIDKLSFSAIKLRMRPNPNVLKLCKFSKKFEVGGSADDVILRLRMDPLVDLQRCRIYSSIAPEATVRIGDLNLKPLQNNLDKMAKNAVEDALTAFLNFQFYDQINRTFDDMIEADCPGGAARRGIEGIFGGGGSGGAGGTSGAGGTDVSALAQRVQQLETRVAALEQRPAGAGGTAATSSGGTPAPQGKAASTTAPSPTAVPAPTPATARPPVASKAGAQNIPGVRMPTIYEGTPCCSVVANPELKGRLGRIVVAYPAGADFKSSGPRTDIFRAGDAKSLRTDYGNFAVEMMPGTYDLTIGGHKVVGVVVEARSDTLVKVGVLQLNASGSTRFDVFPAAGKKALQTLHGQNAIGLPPGAYEVEVNGQREPVTIQAGAITEY